LTVVYIQINKYDGVESMYDGMVWRVMAKRDNVPLTLLHCM